LLDAELWLNDIYKR